MKKIFILILFSYPVVVFGQGLKFSPEIQNTQDPSIIEVRDLWESYVTNYQDETEKTNTEYWNSYEIDNGFTDIVKKEIFIPYLVGNLMVSDIRKVEDDYYKISNTWVLGDNIYMYKFTIYAKKENQKFKLYNSFYVEKAKLRNYQYGNFNFYYPYKHAFNNIKANQSVEFYSKISSLYLNYDKQQITYIIGENLNEAYKYIGFDSIFFDGSSPYAGRIINCENVIILSGREDHIHEVVHAVLIPMFPNTHMLFHEGIATYYGGSVDRQLSTVIEELKKVIIKNPEVDLSRIEDIDTILNNGKVNNFYFIGAIFIDYAQKIGGPDKVLDLLKYPISYEYNYDDARSAIQSVLGIEKNQIDSFLKKYIQNYMGNQNTGQL